MKINQIDGEQSVIFEVKVADARTIIITPWESNMLKVVEKAIQKLIETELLYDLPEDIQELAQLKLENPELSLDALGKMCSEPMTKSSVNRRLQKLCAVAQIEE